MLGTISPNFMLTSTIL